MKLTWLQSSGENSSGGGGGVGKTLVISGDAPCCQVYLVDESVQWGFAPVVGVAGHCCPVCHLPGHAWVCLLRVHVQSPG